MFDYGTFSMEGYAHTIPHYYNTYINNDDNKLQGKNENRFYMAVGKCFTDFHFVTYKLNSVVG
jgi:hypothetical protein